MDSINLAALESAKDAGLSPGTTHSDAYIAGYEMRARQESGAHINDAGTLQIEIERLKRELDEAVEILKTLANGLQYSEFNPYSAEAEVTTKIRITPETEKAREFLNKVGRNG